MKILIIEDDTALNALLADQLSEQGHEVLSATDGQQGLVLALEESPDLVILDIMMPGLDGWTVCRRLRETSNVPIIILTARVMQTDVIQGLELGADDYLTKPFDMRELELRIQAVARRAQPAQPVSGLLFDDGRLRIDLRRRLVLRAGQAVHLTPTEFRLLSHLVQQRGRVVSHEELLRGAWGPEYATETAILSVYVRYLRQKLEENPSDPQYIKTVWGEGYRFAAETEQSTQA